MELNSRVNAFLQCEQLEQSPGYARFQEKLLDETGLIDEPVEVIIEMKSTVSKWQEWKSKTK